MWGRRTVTTDDIRRTLGISQQKSPVPSVKTPEFSKYELKLSDYGNGKICVEISQDPKFNLSPHTPIDVDNLNAIFAQNLHGYWKFWVSTTDEENIAGRKATLLAKNDTDKETSSSRLCCTSPELVKKFIQHLPMATVDVCPSVNKISPLFSKGQKRFEEFKCTASLMRRKQCRKVCAGSSLGRQYQAISHRGDKLLERASLPVNIHLTNLVPS
jgi:hypothetical protein